MERAYKKQDLSRRTFITASSGIAAIAAMIGLGGLARSINGKEFLRPPGGQDESLFLSRCIKCDRCRSACPTSAIGAVHIEESLIASRTPVMKYHIGCCTFCNKCVEACRTLALQPFDVKRVKIGLAVITDRCIALTSGGCAVCEKACAYHAIALDEQKRPIVDPEKCNGCGACEKACPALVLRSYAGGSVRGIVVNPPAKRSAR
jgi:ferredoxin-type protein NapG